MATPLYTFMKDRGTSIYVFPSASRDMNKSFQNPNIKLNFSKFILLNIPKQELARGDGEGQEYGIMNFSNYSQGPIFYNYQPGSGTFPGPVPDLFSEQIIESLRNYVANQDEVIRTSKINTKDDFYNLSEKVSNSEMIFWKWCKKLNLIDLEPAKHQIDWDKNLEDFENQNSSNSSSLDYFREYLWKEREINNYNIDEIRGINADTVQIKVNELMKIKEGDKFIFSGELIENDGVLTGVSYEVFDVQLFEGANKTIFKVNHVGIGQRIFTIGSEGFSCYLDYDQLIQYIGEISVQSKIETSNKSYTEITANIAHHQGKTPTILFKTYDNTNYYPNLEIPILPDEIQEEIKGSENIQSQIRQNPSNYPGSFYGLFDTVDKTYKTENGDKLRKQGDYYGILKTNNIDLDSDNYFEKLSEFNSDNIDGLKIDFDTDHYLKMGDEITNFDEFNSFAFNNQPPEDFEFNAILWYYELDDGSGDIYSNLYGIEFLNNPNDDFDENDPDGQKIRSFQKLVSNGEQDGLSYIYNLDINYRSDNDIIPMQYDPTTLHNNFSFDLYQNVLQTNYLLTENISEIISGFTELQDELFKVKSLIFSQQQYDEIQQRLDNLDSLLNFYSSMRMVDSPTAKVEIDYTKTYPSAKINVVRNEYQEIQNINTSDIRNQNILLQDSNGVKSLPVNIPSQNKLMLNILNDSKELYPDPIKIVLNKDLEYTQSIEIFLIPSNSDIINDIQINIKFQTNTGTFEEELIRTNLPIDLKEYNENDPTLNVDTETSYMNSPIFQYSKEIDSTFISGKTIVQVSEEIFEIGDVIYIDNFWLYDSSGQFVGGDFSGAYKIEDIGTIGNKKYYQIDLSLSNVNTLRTTLKISNYNGMKLDIVRIEENIDGTISSRYKITKELL